MVICKSIALDFESDMGLVKKFDIELCLGGFDDGNDGVTVSDIIGKEENVLTDVLDGLSSFSSLYNGSIF